MKYTIKLMFCIGLIGICFFLNLFIFWSVQFKQPIFLKHYYELGLQEGTAFKIGGLMNKDDPRQLVEIAFPEFPEMGDFFRVRSEEQFNLNAHHEKREYWIEYVNKGDMLPIEEEMTLTRAKMTFSNGDEMDIDIGQIVFYPIQYENNVLDIKMSRASSSGEIALIGRFTEDVYLEEIKSTLDPLVKDLIKIEVNGRGTKAQFFKQGMTWKLEGRMKIEPTDSRKFNYYEVQSRIYFKDTEGKMCVKRILNLRHEPNFNKIESYKYLGKAGE